jgi:hypothetical protein
MNSCATRQVSVAINLSLGGFILEINQNLLTLPTLPMLFVVVDNFILLNISVDLLENVT